jgi:hypothetical protein
MKMHNKKLTDTLIDKEWETVWMLFPDKALRIYSSLKNEESPRKNIKNL